MNWAVEYDGGCRGFYDMTAAMRFYSVAGGRKLWKRQPGGWEVMAWAALIGKTRREPV